MKLLSSMIFALAFLCSPMAFAAPDIRVLDGDTLNVPMKQVQDMPERVSIRLIGVNTPETRGAACEAEKLAGEAAKVYVRDRIANAKVVRSRFIRWDKYGGRVDGHVTVDGEDLATELVKLGMAVPYSGGKRVNVWCK